MIISTFLITLLTVAIVAGVIGLFFTIAVFWFLFQLEKEREEEIQEDFELNKYIDEDETVIF